jgi:hypothetical protein
VFQLDVERELINPFIVYLEPDCKIKPDAEEISCGRYWHLDEIERNLGKGVFTPNFESEYKLIKQYIK